MFKFSSGLIIGIILSTVGVNGVVKLSDNILNNVQDTTRKATYSQNQNQQQSRQVPPSIPSNQNQQQSRQYSNILPDERRAPQIDRDITQPSYDPYNGLGDDS